MDIGPIVIVIAFGSPLLMLLWFLTKIAKGYIKKKKLLKLVKKDTKEEYIILLLLSFAIAIVLSLILFLLGFIFAPNFIRSLPIVMVMLIMTIISTAYGCLAGFLRGLGEVVGAGGSAREVIKTLAVYINEYTKVDDPIDHNQKLENNSEEKDHNGSAQPSLHKQSQPKNQGTKSST